MTQSASATSVGAGAGAAAKTPARSMVARSAAGGSSGTVRQRRTATTSSSTSGRSSASTGSMWRFYTDDSPGIKVGPLPVLVGSLIFIATVFVLHIWGKYTRS